MDELPQLITKIIISVFLKYYYHFSFRGAKLQILSVLSQKYGLKWLRREKLWGYSFLLQQESPAAR